MAAGRSLYAPPAWLGPAMLGGVALALVAVGLGLGFLLAAC